ncbi:MAG TPA: glutamyl-tRNA reductase [Flavipsychrobacter sp.]|nr:glutamyl-tRNA reductase [Flavipsychrobacter sp.]
MQQEERRNLSDFYLIGINYRKTDATIRGQFAINSEQYPRLLKNAASLGLNQLFVLSTCNRTEVYGFAPTAGQLIGLLCTETTGDQKTFERLAYIKKGLNAVDHLFHVSAGLDSQVLGDYEIIGQVKQSVKFAKEKGFIGAFLERAVNSALQASKAIKTNTKLSGGTVSVSFSAIQYIRENVADFKNKSILLLGVGKIGKSTCKNIVDYLGCRNVTLINRTAEKAAALAAEFGLMHAGIEETDKAIKSADIIITATTATSPIINGGHLSEAGEKVLIDLSVPYNIDPSVKNLPNITLLNVDDLSKMKDETLKMREEEVPKAKAIIGTQIAEFAEWWQMRHNVPVLIALKKKLNQIEQCPLAKSTVEELTGALVYQQRVEKVIKSTALKLKSNNQRGCYYIEAINEFMTA